MYPNTITHYTVRRPGEVAWCDTKFRSLARALAEAERADRVCTTGHRVYAVHRDGCTTGPYRADASF